VFALLCYNRAVALLGATTSSAFLPLIPALATLAAMPLLHEYPTSIEWLGIALAGGGVLLSTGIVRLPRRR
jgi:drug/metabolite transporter (DMT)-like permease